MAMLAEPRQRKRYNLTPRGKALYEDDSRFGTKMLEKMGWSKGKGLGAKEDGGQDFVRVRMRNTNEGLGYEDRDDHWTQHDQDFNGLLKSLTGTGEKSVKAGEDKGSALDEELQRVGFGFVPEPIKLKVEKLKDKISGISLEEKSKLSKARVHYKKFTKGKDIAQYSEKDLANIFGKKAVEAVGTYAELTAITDRQERKVEENPGAVVEKDVKPNFGGVQTISAGLSVSDYFKQKMEAMKSKQNPNTIANNEHNHNEELKDVEGAQVPVEAKTKSKRKRQETGVYMEKKSCGKIEANETRKTIKKKMESNNDKLESKKLSKNSELGNEKSLNNLNTQGTEAGIESKKYKTKIKRTAIEVVDLNQEQFVEDSEAPMKKKKKCKDGAEEQHMNKPVLNTLNKQTVNIANTEHKKKKKKSKDSLAGNHYNEPDVITLEEVVIEVPKKQNKSKKSKVEKQEEHLAFIASNDGNQFSSSQPPRKKKKKDKIAQHVEKSLFAETSINDGSLGEAVVMKNKKSRTKEKLQANTQTLKNLPDKGENRAEIVPQQKQLEKDVPVNAADGGPNKKLVSEEMSFQSLTLDELISKCNSFNVYTVSSFCAEKFRNVDLDKFKGATLPQFPGYSYNEKDLKLNVVEKPGDERRITQLWNCSINKYQEANPSAIFGKYKHNVVKVYNSKNKKQKQRIPRFYMKSLKRKNVFQSI